ncbi:MAG: ParB N-terminal domain-containing protein [Candidatus Aphodocola sp.]
MEEKEIKTNLPKLDDLFSSEKERYESSLEKIENISIKDIDNFPNHPFKVIENEELLQMIESIKDKGVIVPVLVRPKENGSYEMDMWSKYDWNKTTQFVYFKAT